MIDFLSANWLWLLVLGLFIAMHAGGHGCGMHGGHHHRSHERRRDDAEVRTDKLRTLQRGSYEDPR